MQCEYTPAAVWPQGERVTRRPAKARPRVYDDSDRQIAGESACTHENRCATAGLMFSMFAAGALFAQTGTQESPGVATGVRAIIHSVADLGKTVSFYRDGLGLEMFGPGGKPVTALSAPMPLDESLSKFTATHGASFRNAYFQNPRREIRSRADRVHRYRAQSRSPAHAGSRRRQPWCSLFAMSTPPSPVSTRLAVRCSASAANL